MLKAPSGDLIKPFKLRGFTENSSGLFFQFAFRASVKYGFERCFYFYVPVTPAVIHMCLAQTCPLWFNCNTNRFSCPLPVLWSFLLCLSSSFCLCLPSLFFLSSLSSFFPSVLQSSVRNEVMATSHVTDEWMSLMEMSSLNCYIVRRYIATPSGVLRIYPGSLMDKAFDPTRRQW